MNENWKHITRASSCPELNELELYYAGKLDEEKRFAVENHLADCEACRDYLDGLSVLPEHTDLNSIEKKLKKEVHHLLYPEKKNRFVAFSYKKLAVAASILFVLGISLFLMQRFEKHPAQITEQLIPKPTLQVDDTIAMVENRGEETKKEIVPSVHPVVAQNLTKKKVSAEKVTVIEELVSTENTTNGKVVQANNSKVAIQSKGKDITNENMNIRIRGAASVSSNQVAYGKIVDENGEPLPGVNVYNPKQKDGVVSNLDGYFIISAQPGDSLQIAFVGFEQVDLAVDQQKELNVKMKPSVLALDEVVVVGYGVQKKKELVGSVASSKVEATKFQRLIHPEWRKVKKLEMRYSALPDSMKNDWSNSKKEAIKYSYYKNEYMTVQHLEKLLKLSEEEQGRTSIQKAIDAVNVRKFRKARRIIQTFDDQ